MISPPSRRCEQAYHGPQGVFSKAGVDAAEAVGPIAQREGEVQPRVVGIRCGGGGPARSLAAHLCPSCPWLRLRRGCGVPPRCDPDPVHRNPGPLPAAGGPVRLPRLAPPVRGGRRRVLGRGPAETRTVPASLRVQPLRDVDGRHGPLLRDRAGDRPHDLAAVPELARPRLDLPDRGRRGAADDHLDGDDLARPRPPRARRCTWSRS